MCKNPKPRTEFNSSSSGVYFLLIFGVGKEELKCTIPLQITGRDSQSGYSRFDHAVTVLNSSGTVGPYKLS